MICPEDDWNLLLRQDDPKGWHPLGEDLAFWKPQVERVCASHGLAIEVGMDFLLEPGQGRAPVSGYMGGTTIVQVHMAVEPINMSFA